MNTAEHSLIENIPQLPPTRLAEVAGFGIVWDNDADAVCGAL